MSTQTPMVTPQETAAVKAELERQETERLNATKRYSRGKLIMRRFMRNWTAVIGVVMLIVIVLLAILGPYIGEWDHITRDRGQNLKPPNPDHWFGTDSRARDIFAMTVRGLRTSLIIGFAVAFIQTAWAALFGAAAAYFGKWFDKVATWLIDLLLVVPSFLIIAVINQKTGGSSSSIFFFVVLLAAFGWMLTARVVRSMTMSVKNLDYVNAARYMSVPSFVIITKHIIPNISSLLIIDFTLGIAAAVLSETSLSYFGLGIKDPQVSLGTLIGNGQASALTHSWLFIPPALVLVFMLVAVNFIGDGLRDAIDPSSKSGGAA